MIVAINTRVLSGNHANARLLQTCFEAIATQHPGHSFHFISDKKNSFESAPLQNVTNHVIEQQSNSPLLWKLWYNYKLPALLRKIQAAVLVHADGIVSLRTQVPQYVFVNELVSKKDDGGRNKKYHRFMLSNQSLFLQKAAHILTATMLLDQQIQELYKPSNNKVSVLYPVADVDYQPLDWSEKELVKEQYTQGKDYFLFAGSLQQHSNLINLLKAFSFFKRRQKSNMQLVIAAEHSTGDNGFTTSLETYKYRKEVVLLQNVEPANLVKITGAAYAVVNLSRQANNVTGMVSAMHCNVPVLLSDNETNKELFADSALYADPESFEDIADKMMLLFKDEDRRAGFINLGTQQLQQFNLQKNAAALWENILAAIQ